MKEISLNKLIEAGVDVNDALTRFSGRERIYIRYLVRINKDSTFSELAEEISEGRYDDAKISAHKLMNVCKNLGLNEAGGYAHDMVVAYYNGNMENAMEKYNLLRKSYEKAIEAIEYLAAEEEI